MSKRPDPATRGARGFLMSLARDVKGNTFAMMGMGLIPLAGMVGGGLDLSRMYIVKTRLQHACDAGALAGRRAMGGGTWSYSNYYPRTEARRFFDANFKSGVGGSDNLVRDFTERAGKVTGTASADVPMTLMKIFGEGEKSLSVTCDAEMRLPNTDVMFVLDTTGSMGSSAGGGQTRIQALRVAVKCFYEIVARLDTNANCTTGVPSGGTGDQVQVRFGFVPYASGVNVGKLLNPSWFAASWEYETRTPRWWVRRAAPASTSSNKTSGSISNGNCKNNKLSSVTTNYSNNNKTRETIGVVATNADHNSGICSWTETVTTTIHDWREGGFGRPEDEFIEWRYDRLPIDVSQLKNGTTWNNSFQWPIGDNGEADTVSWDGCIEERQTARAASYDPRPSDAFDLDIDLVPTADVRTQWAPALKRVIYTRNQKNGNGTGTWSRSARITSDNDYKNGSAYQCPTEARKLQVWNDAATFSSYVDGLVINGTTYHDIGLLWGSRFVSPTGLFKDENEFTPKGGEIERHLIFMTDGTTNANADDYNAYGIPWYARRQTADGSVPSKSQLDDQVDARFAAICTFIKNKNVTLWVIGFGGEIAASPATQTRLTTCASPDRYFLANDAAELQQTFKEIADQISMLRLTS